MCHFPLLFQEIKILSCVYLFQTVLWIGPVYTLSEKAQWICILDNINSTDFNKKTSSERQQNKLVCEEGTFVATDISVP